MHTNSNTRETILKKLNCIGLPLGIFHTVLTSGEMHAQKPDIKAFEILIQASDVEPEEILYIGDRIHTELVPAKSLGINTCLISENTVQYPSVDLNFKSPNDFLKSTMI